MELSSALERKDILTPATPWTNPEGIVLSETFRDGKSSRGPRSWGREERGAGVE